MVMISPPIRSDSAGDGHYGASRGPSRTHKGTDYAIVPGSHVLAPTDGIVGRHGYAYADDLQWRITDFHCDDGHRFRYFYATQYVVTGERVKRGDILATAQDISRRYPDQGMTAHVHLSIYDSNNVRINPESFTI